MLIISIPFAAKSLPVNPLLSQEGDHLQRKARLISSLTAICRTILAPFSKNLVTSSPVVSFLSSFSGLVKKARPLFLLIGGRGQVRPPSISGQTAISSIPVFFSRKRFIVGLIRSFFPCQRQGTPKRHDETSIFSISMNQG